MEVKPIVQLPMSSCIDNFKPLPDPIPVLPPNSVLLLKSIKRLSPLDGSLVSVYLQVAGEIIPNSPYTLNSNNEALLNIRICLQNSLTFSLSQSINSGAIEFVNQQTVSITDIISMTPLIFLGINDESYTLTYEITIGECASES